MSAPYYFHRRLKVALSGISTLLILAGAVPAAYTETQAVQPLPQAANVELAQATSWLNELSYSGWQADIPYAELLEQNSNLNYGSAQSKLNPNMYAELKEYKCSGFSLRLFRRGQRTIQTFIYCFPDFRLAYGAYSVLRAGATTVVKRGGASSEEDDSITFYQDRFVVYIRATSTEDDESKEAMRAFADRLSASIGGQSPLPEILALLPGFDKISGSEKIIQGSLIARRVLDLPYIGQLQFEKAITAACATYQFREPFRERLQACVIVYPNQELAQSMASAYAHNLGSYHQAVSSTNPYLIKIDKNFLFVESFGQYVIAVSGSHKKQAPYILARQIKQLLSRKP